MQGNQPTREQISKRAYEIYLRRGRQHGNDRNDWLQAERELMQSSASQKTAARSAAKAGADVGILTSGIGRAGAAQSPRKGDAGIRV